MTSQRRAIAGPVSAKKRLYTTQPELQAADQAQA